MFHVSFFVLCLGYVSLLFLFVKDKESKLQLFLRNVLNFSIRHILYPQQSAHKSTTSKVKSHFIVYILYQETLFSMVESGLRNKIKRSQTKIKDYDRSEDTQKCKN